jgi:cbb3-type cytochrome oxidase subunit 1
VWFVRASLIHLVIGVTLGALLLADIGLPGGPPRWLAALRPLHVEVLLFGWVVQLVMGVALWIFPRFGVPRSSHGRPALAWAAFALLNAGVVLVGLTPAVFAGRLAEVGAAGAFAANLWGWVRASGLSEM